MSTIKRQIPAEESGYGNTIHTKSGEIYRISYNPEKRRHTLWKKVSGGYEKIESASSPLDLHKYIPNFK